MEVVILHSHLNPGGVTRIIESQVESLKGNSIVVAAGDFHQSEKIHSSGATIVENIKLNYLENKSYSDREAVALFEEIFDFLEELLKPKTILHVHNLNLGKNPALTYAVYRLAKKGYPVFNHAHDFAEDRPVNLKFLREMIEGNFKEKLNEVLYPDLTNYHFGVLNSFDRKRLQKFGVDKKRILWLPNPVTFRTSEKMPDKNAAKTDICKSLNLDEKKLLVTYPVRVIQRKNIGEFIFLSVLFKDEANFVVTQPPKNPIEVALYQQWLDFCQTNKTEVVFEAGNKVDFEKLLVASDFCITTSYKEGFGMAYLEPWLLNTPVVGRNIDFLTQDFYNDGFYFPALYDELKIPGYKQDFKDVKMEKQMQIISAIFAGRLKKETVVEQNLTLKTLFNRVSEQEIKNNIEIIKNNYSLEKYGIKLQNRYKKMVG